MCAVHPMMIRDDHDPADEYGQTTQAEVATLVPYHITAFDPRWRLLTLVFLPCLTWTGH